MKEMNYFKNILSLLFLIVFGMLFIFISCGDKDDDISVLSWEKTFGDLGEAAGYSVQQTLDGGYIVAGAKGGSVYLIKTDSKGNALWDRTFKRASMYGDIGYSVQQTSDGGYIIVGGGDRVSSVINLIKVDSNGNVEWEKTFGDAYAVNVGYSGKQTSDGGYIIAGETSPFYKIPSDGYLIKTDSNGNIKWEKTFGDLNLNLYQGASRDVGYSVQQTLDSGYIVAGAKGGSVYLIKTGTDGNTEWEKTFGGTDINDAIGYSVQQTSDGGYIIAGETYSYERANNDMYLIKTNSYGNTEWEKTFIGEGLAYGRSVNITSDGGYIVVGVTWSNLNGSSNSDVLLIKTDANGNIF